MTSASHTGRPLARSLGASAALHLVGIAVATWAASPAADRDAGLVDIELAPEPPKAEALPAEVARARQASPAAHDEEPSPPPSPSENEGAPGDAGIDAAIDAPVDAPRKRKRLDAAVEMVAEADAGVDAAADLDVLLGEGGSAGPAIVGPNVPVAGGPGLGAGGPGSGAGSGSETGLAEVATAGSGAPGMTTEPAVGGAPTTAGTAADLLAYFPAGHVVAAVIRFDRLRGSEWAEQTEKLLRPLPDYRGLFGERNAKLADQLDTLVIASPRPRDASATTLVAHSHLTRGDLVQLLANPDTPIAWSRARGGMLGRRSGKLFPADKRVVLSPWAGWFTLAQPDDLAGLLAPAAGRAETAEARGKLPPWLDTIRTIEKETGEDKRGPALVLTLAGDGQRHPVPDLGLGVTALPFPERISLALELVHQGWLIRGNVTFGSEADAVEVTAALEGARQRVVDSHVMSALLRRQHVLDIVKGLSLARTGARVSYATSLSISDARALLDASEVGLRQYFGRTP